MILRRKVLCSTLSPTFNERLSFIIAGQSNASGRGSTAFPEPSNPSVYLFGNDYMWKMAYEPVDDPAYQVDLVSLDSQIVPGWGHSFALSAANRLVVPGRRIDLIPCAKGGTSISEWMPSSDRFDRSTLYGSANYRRSIACPGGVPTAIWYYGHENQAGASDYYNQWSALVSEFRVDFGENVPFIFCQLAKCTVSHPNPLQNHYQHLTAEVMRKFETGSGDETSMSNMFMVVTFDLSLVDQIHLDTTANKELGRRIALATRQHVLGEAVDGTGPRLVSVTRLAANQVRVKTTQTLAEINNNADGQFRVYDDDAEMTISSVVRDPDDYTAVRITMTSNASGTITVSYGDVVASAPGVTLSNVVKNAEGLPLPQFGLQVAA